MTAKILMYSYASFNEDIKDNAIKYKKILNSKTYNNILNYDHTMSIGFNPYEVIQYLIMCSGPVDRTGTIKPYNFSYPAMPKYNENFNKSYTNVTLERARQIWEMDDTVDVLFSGGIDSITACVSLIETKPSNKKLRIICSESTEKEFPNCYDVKLLKEFMIKKTNSEIFNVKNLTPNNIIVTGEPGSLNHVGGVDLSSIKDGKIHKMYNIIGENIDDVPWTNLWKWTNKIIPENRPLLNTINDTMRKNFNRFFKEHIKQAPYEIKTYNDMRWWLHFAFRPNFTLYAIPAMIIVSAPTLPKKVDVSKWVGFFNNEDWQLWNMKKHVTKTKDSYPYKKEAKEFIKRFIPLTKFIDNKHKDNSLRHTKNYPKLLTWNPKRVVILDDGQIFNTLKLTPELIEELVCVSS